MRNPFFALAHAITHNSHHFYNTIIYVRWQDASTFPLLQGYVKTIALIAIISKGQVASM